MNSFREIKVKHFFKQLKNKFGLFWVGLKEIEFDCFRVKVFFYLLFHIYLIVSFQLIYFVKVFSSQQIKYIYRQSPHIYLIAILFFAFKIQVPHFGCSEIIRASLLADFSVCSLLRISEIANLYLIRFCRFNQKICVAQVSVLNLDPF